MSRIILTVDRQADGSESHCATKQKQLLPHCTKQKQLLPRLAKQNQLMPHWNKQKQLLPRLANQTQLMPHWTMPMPAVNGLHILVWLPLMVRESTGAHAQGQAAQELVGRIVPCPPTRFGARAECHAHVQDLHTHEQCTHTRRSGLEGVEGAVHRSCVCSVPGEDRRPCVCARVCVCEGRAGA